MKHNRWLVILVIGLLVVNIGFFVLIRYNKIDIYLKNKIVFILEKNLSANIDIEHFSLNDKQIFANNIIITDTKSQYSLNIKQIHIDYNLFKFLFMRKNRLYGIPEKTISNIRIYNPQLILNFDYKKSDKKLEFPDLYPYFDNLILYDGTAYVAVSDKNFAVQKEFSQIEIKIENDISKLSSLITVISKSEGELISLVIDKNKGKKPIIKSDIENLLLKKIEIDNLGTFDSRLSLNLNFDKHDDYFLKFTDIHFSLDDKVKKYINYNDISIDSIIVNGNESKVYLEIEKITADESMLSVFGSLKNPFSFKKADYLFNLKAQNLNLKNIKFNKGSYLDDLHSICDLNAILYGLNNKLSLKASVYSDSLVFKNESITNLNLSLNSEDIFKSDTIIKINEAYFLDSKLKGSGSLNINNNQFEMNLVANDIRYIYNDLSTNCNLETKIFYDFLDPFSNKLKITTGLSLLTLQYQDYALKNISSNVVYEDNILTFNITQESTQKRFFDFKPLTNKTIYNIKENTLKSHFNFNNFNINQINDRLANLNLNGNFEIDNSNVGLQASGDLKLGNSLIKDYYFKVLPEVTYLKNHDSLDISIQIDDSYFNYSPVKIDFKASGNKNSFETSSFIINNIFNAELAVDIQDSLYYDFTINADQVQISEISSLYFNRNLAKNFQGLLSMSLSLNNKEDIPLNFNLHLDSLKYTPYGAPTLVNDIFIDINGYGQLHNIEIDKLEIFKKNNKLLESTMNIIDYGKKINLKAKSNTLLESFNENNVVEGRVISTFNYLKDENDITAELKIIGDNLRYDKFFIDKIDIEVLQRDEGILFNKFSVISENELNLKIEGVLNYNLFNGTVYPESDTLNIIFEANLANYLKKLSSIIITGDAGLYVNTQVSMNEDGLFLNNGKVRMNNGWLRILSQQELLDRITIDADISHNRLIFNDFRARMGKGRLYIRNEISDNDENFHIANLNLGIFYLKTDEIGLLFHLPRFMPHNSVANAIISGRNKNETIITGPFDDIKIVGDVYFSNGNGIYPGESENLLRLFNFVRTEIKTYQESIKYESLIEKNILPFRLDLMMHFTKNCRYVTYPMNLKTTSDSYLHLLYTDTGWFANEADFKAEEGNIELFGTSFLVDYAQVRISPFEVMPSIFGSFYKKVADGTTITLEIFTDKSGNKSIWDSFILKLSSDDSDDKSMTHILAKLKYGKSLDELSDSQYQNIVQDEAIQMLGIGIGSALLDPYISPVENYIRKFLKLDSFNISPGFVHNLINSKTWSASKNEENESTAYNSSILLNNLTLSMGKYITNNMFLEYSILFQEGTDLANNTNTFMYQNFGLRYDLPYRLKLRYSYEINQDQQDNAHEIFLMRSFKF